jgi:hypothetical protein
MKNLIMLLMMAVLIWSPCHAEEQSFFEKNDVVIGYAPFSYHFDRPDKGDDINENPNAIAISVNGWGITTFNNSFHDQSYFIGKHINWKRWGNDFFWGINVGFGLLKGYNNDFNVGGWTPAVAPTFEVGYQKVSLDTMYMPTENGGVIASMIKYYF